MFFDSLAPVLVSTAGTVLFAAGVVLLLTGRDRFGSTPSGLRRLLWAITLCEVGVVAWIVALWVDGNGWLPGRIVATVAVLAGVTYAVWRLRRLARARRAQFNEQARP